ncbi:MAG TPA: Rieske (2Fe-2S) protein [Dehalococcoidia bacterium]|nr:Rieske (2Fe-2S) protein [Dehalococcoidia bacterium]
MADEATTPQELPVATPDPARSLAVDTPVAKPLPRREAITRRVFLLGGFWTGIGLALVGFLGSPLSFLWQRNIAGFGGPITISPDRVPEAGGNPNKIFEGRFYILNTEPTEATPGGLLALWQKCPHLGCTVPYRPEFTFEQRQGWFRCPCHGSTYTKEAGVLVAGPAPRPMDVFPLAVNDDLSVTVQTGRQFEGTGSSANPFRAVAYEAGAVTPEPGEAGGTATEDGAPAGEDGQDNSEGEEA